MVSARLWSVLTHHHPRIPYTKHFNSNRSSLEGKLSQRDNDTKNLLTANHHPFKLPFTNCFTMFCLDVSTYHHISSFFGWLQLHQVADLESEEILRAAVSAAPVGCRPGPGNGQPTNGTNARSAIGVFSMNKIQSQSWVVVWVYHVFSYFFMVYHGFIIFSSCWAIPSIWVQRCSAGLWVWRGVNPSGLETTPGLGFKMIQYDLIWFNTHTHISVYICINIYIYTHLHIFTHIFTCMYIYICIHLCAWLTWILKCIYMIWYDSSCF